MDVSENRDTPKWMVYNGNPYKNGWFGGTTIFGNTHIWVASSQQIARVFSQCSIEVILGLSAHPLLFNSRRPNCLEDSYFPYISILLEKLSHEKKQKKPYFPPIIAVCLFFFPYLMVYEIIPNWAVFQPPKNTLNHQAWKSFHFTYQVGPYLRSL